MSTYLHVLCLLEPSNHIMSAMFAIQVGGKSLLKHRQLRDCCVTVLRVLFNAVCWLCRSWYSGIGFPFLVGLYKKSVQCPRVFQVVHLDLLNLNVLEAYCPRKPTVDS